jgi:hypothetical protein
VKIILPIGTEGSAGHIVSLSSVVKKDRSSGHQENYAVLICMAVCHFFFFDGDCVSQVVSEIQPPVAFVPVVEEEVCGFFIPTILENDFFPWTSSMTSWDRVDGGITGTSSSAQR